jgi:hypothetical protein
VLTTVAGTGYSTPAALDQAEILNAQNGFVYTAAGDGIVTVASALIDQSAQYTVQSAHSTLPRVLAQIGALAAWILAERDPPGPAPPPAEVPGIYTPQISDPPIALNFGVRAPGDPCSSGKCPC